MWFPESKAWNPEPCPWIICIFTALLKSKAYWRVQVRFKFERQQINLNQIQVRANQLLFFEERVKPEYSRKHPKTRGKTSRSMESTRESNLGHKNQRTLLLQMEQNEWPISAFVLYWRCRCDVAHQMKRKLPSWYKWRERINIWFCVILYLSRFQKGVFEVTFLTTWNC